MPRALRLLVPLDRLDGRRHTFGTYLSGWLDAMRPFLEEITITRGRERSYPLFPGYPQISIPPWLESERNHRLLFPLWARGFLANIIHFPYRYAPYTWWGWGVKKVVTVHDTAPLSLPGDLVSNLRPRTVWRYRHMLNKYDAVITVSNASKEELCRHFRLAPDKVHVIYHGVDGRFSPGPPSPVLKEKYGLDGPIILNVSSLKKKKNITGLIKAFSRLKQDGYPHRLALVGKNDNAADDINRLINELSLRDAVILTGFVAADDHPHFYRLADLMVYPSFYEGFGLPVLEAFACGCPVVTSAASSLPEVAGDAAVLVDPEDTEGLYRAMKSILDDPGLRRYQIEKGLRRAGRFTWEESAKKHLELYQSILETTPTVGNLT